MKKTNAKPLVSVILPVFNAEKYLAEAIESILTQTHSNFELIIVDDASTDGSWKVITSYKSKYPTVITAVKLKKNRNKGGDEAGNVAFGKTKGEFIARMDADDIAHPLRLQKQLDYMLQHTECGVLGSSALVIDGNGVKIGVKRALKTHEDIYNNYFTFHPLIHPTVMIRRSALPNTKELYKIAFPKNNDYFTFFSLINLGVRFANLTDNLLSYRMHGKNDSLRNVKQTFANTMRIRAVILKKYGYKPSLKAWITCAAQVTLISLMPESLLFSLYLLARGIHTPKTIFNKMKQLVNLNYSFKL